MSIETKKIDLVQKIINIRSESLLNKIEGIINELDDDWYSQMNASEKIHLEKAINQANNAEGIPHKEMIKKYSKWL